MIDQVERERVREALGDMLDLAPPVLERPDAVEASIASPDRPHGRLMIVMVAAAVVVVGLVGLVAVAGRGSSDTPATQPTSSDASSTDSASPSEPQLLSNVEELGASDWVVASELPDGVEWLYARRVRYPDSASERPQAVAYGNRTGEELWVEIRPAIERVPTGVIWIDGIEWSTPSHFSTEPWTAIRRMGDLEVEVRCACELGSRILEGLVVVDEAALPTEPLGRLEDAVAVARTTLDGEVYTYSVQESGEFKCDWVTSATGTTNGCGSRVQSNTDVTIDLGATNDPGALPDTIDAVRSGSVTAAAASVEVVLIDGTTVTVEPTDLSGAFDRLFWIAATTIDTDLLSGVPVADETVAVVRAYNSDGELIGTAVPPALADPGEEPATEEE